jgi:hypothetical protein
MTNRTDHGTGPSRSAGAVVSPTIEARLRSLEDEEAISGLLMKGWRALDEKDWETWIYCWHPEAEFTFGLWEPLRGREAILDAVKTAEAPYAAMMHYVHNTHFEIDGDHASGIGYMQFVGIPDSAAAGEHFDMGGPYTWEFIRTSEGWRVLKMHLGARWTQGTDTLGAFVD